MTGQTCDTRGRAQAPPHMQMRKLVFATGKRANRSKQTSAASHTYTRHTPTSQQLHTRSQRLQPCIQQPRPYSQQPQTYKPTARTHATNKAFPTQSEGGKDPGAQSRHKAPPHYLVEGTGGRMTTSGVRQDWGQGGRITASDYRQGWGQGGRITPSECQTGLGSGLGQHLIRLGQEYSQDYNMDYSQDFD